MRILSCLYAYKDLVHAFCGGDQSLVSVVTSDSNYKLLYATFSVQGLESKSSVKATSVLKHGAIYPAQRIGILF